jgi:hypothetical protein
MNNNSTLLLFSLPISDELTTKKTITAALQDYLTLTPESIILQKKDNKFCAYLTVD